MPRFPAAILTGQDYTLEFSGTPPQKIRIKLEAAVGATKIKIPYPVAGTYGVSKRNDKKEYARVTENKWDDSIQAQALISKKSGSCGENRYVGVENYLEFYIEPGCDLKI